MTLVGLPLSGSSNAPTRTTMRSGRFSASLNSGVPHLGQKRRRMVFPLSAVLTCSLTSPARLKPAVLKIALIDALPDDRYWQSLHQQARVATGGCANRKRTAPQKHRPVTGCMVRTLSRVCEAADPDPTAPRILRMPIRSAGRADSQPIGCRTAPGPIWRRPGLGVVRCPALPNNTSGLIV